MALLERVRGARGALALECARLARDDDLPDMDGPRGGCAVAGGVGGCARLHARAGAASCRRRRVLRRTPDGGRRPGRRAGIRVLLVPGGTDVDWSQHADAVPTDHRCGCADADRRRYLANRSQDTARCRVAWCGRPWDRALRLTARASGRPRADRARVGARPWLDCRPVVPRSGCALSTLLSTPA